MSNSTNLKSVDSSTDPRNIEKLARVYAQNRSLEMVVSLLLFLVIFFAISILSILCGFAYHYERWFLFVVCLAADVAVITANIYFAMPRWGGKLIGRITERLYAREGIARFTPSHTQGQSWATILVGILFMSCILATVVLFSFDFIPIIYMQPVSAIYIVPFLLFIILQNNSVIRGPIAFLWPTLYTLHALLLLAGVPLFAGQWDYLLNMFIPTFGYGLLTALIAHVYSRIALRKLRQALRADLQDASVEEGQL